MIEFLAAALIATALNNNLEEISRFCATVVNIQYASDNFSDDEYKRFRYCVDTLNK